MSLQTKPSLFSFADVARWEIKDSTSSRLASFRVGVPQKSAAYALTRLGSRSYWRIKTHRRSRSLGCPLLEPFWWGGFTDWFCSGVGFGEPVSQPNSSTEHSPIP